MLTYFLALSVAFISCSEKSVTSESQAEISSADPYAEISIKEGGEWQEGSSGHNDYIGGFFTNVENLTNPAEHTDHTGYIRFEGPAWENQNVGYRLYLDWRNAIDIFGKKMDSLALPYVGQENFDSYHDSPAMGRHIRSLGSLRSGGHGLRAIMKYGSAVGAIYLRLNSDID